MTEELLDRVSHLPSPVDVFITTTDQARAGRIRTILDRRKDAGIGRSELRVVPSKLGRHMSAFLIECRDVLVDGAYDLVVKLHSNKSSRKSFNASRYFVRHQFENLLSSPGYVANVLALFQREPGLGVVFPPMIHIGIPTMGRGWSVYRPRAEQLLTASMGVEVPLDGVSPLAPLGGMWIARPEALSLLLRRQWAYEDFPPSKDYPDADLARTMERTIAYVAGERGYHCRTILNAEHAAISHTAIEYKLDQLSSTTPGYPIEQIQFLHRAGWTGHGGVVGLARMYLRLNHPGASRAIDPVYTVARRTIIGLKATTARVRGRA